MSNDKTKIKNKSILKLHKIKNTSLILYIQGFISHRHYILPFLIESDELLSNKLTIFNYILKTNTLSYNLIENLYTFLSDRMLYEIINKENIMDDSQYLKEENDEDSIIKTYQKRITYIYKNCKYYYNYNSSKINNEILEKYIPNDKEFYLFILDYLSLKNKELYNNYITYFNFNFCEDKDKGKEKIILIFIYIKQK